MSDVRLIGLAVPGCEEERKEIEVLPGGWLKLIDVMGNDLSIINDARQSYDVEHKEISENDKGLIEFLMKHRHGTPFEGVEFKFQIQAPLPVAREVMRHRFASYNEISGRYVKQTLGFYHPDKTAIRTQVGKPGAYHYEKIKDANIQYLVIQMFEDAYSKAYENYEQMLDLGVAKELARNVLPQGMFTKFMMKLNARGLMNFLSLRNNERAMHEIRMYAQAIEEIFAEHLPLTHNAFVNNGRIAP